MKPEVIAELKKEYPDSLVQIELLSVYISQLQEASFERKKELLENIQQIINDFYNEKHCDVLIDVQAEINNYRYEYDIHDPREVLFVVDGSEFVQ